MPFEINRNLFPTPHNAEMTGAISVNAEMTEPTNSLIEKKKAFIKHMLTALMPDISTAAPLTHHSAKSVLDKFEKLSKDYLVDENAEEQLPSKLDVLSNKIQQSHLRAERQCDGIDAIKSQQNARNSEVGKHLKQMQEELRDDRLRANANYSALSAAIKTTREQDQTVGEKPWDGIEAAIENIQENYLKFFSGLMQKYTEMYEKFNDLIQKAAADAVGEGKDSNTVNFDAGKLNTAYNKFKDYIDKNSPGSIPGWAQMTPEQRAAMADNLKPAFNINMDEKSKDFGKISYNLSQFDELKKDKLTQGDSVKTPPIYEYQSWLAHFNAVGSALQSNMNSFAQRYKQANDTANNLYKVLSGSVNTWGEIMKGMIQGWR